MSILVDGNGDIYVENTLVATLAASGIKAAKPATDLMGLTTLSQLNAAASNGTPLGCVSAFAGTSVPAGWTICDGRALSRTDYADLFALLGTTFGAGNGSTTFNLPDLRGEFIRGWDGGRGVDAGRGFGSWQADEFRSHNHTFNFPNITNNSGGGGIDDAGGGGAVYNTNYSGGSETRPRNVALVFCIRSHFVSGGSSSGTPTQVVTPARSWKSVLASRALGGVYSNPTSTEIKVSVSITSSAASTAGTRPRFAVFIDTERIIVQQVGDLNGSNYADATENISFEVPAGATYSVKYLDGTNTLQLVEWSELRSWT